jgi:mannose-6-phosphate isomerase-like protein (cupin superfamily)
MRRATPLLAAIATLCAVASVHAQSSHGHPATPPEKSYEKGAQRPPNAGDYVIKLEQMASFYDVPGEFGHIMLGKEHGFQQLSFIITETRPGGGPPLHRHDTEEAHVVLSGTASYVIEHPSTGKRRTFTVRGPYVVRIPARHAHTFVNAGEESLHLIGALPDSDVSYHEIGPNPLIKP